MRQTAWMSKLLLTCQKRHLFSYSACFLAIPIVWFRESAKNAWTCLINSTKLRCRFHQFERTKCTLVTSTYVPLGWVSRFVLGNARTKSTILFHQQFLPLTWQQKFDLKFRRRYTLSRAASLHQIVRDRMHAIIDRQSIVCVFKATVYTYSCIKAKHGHKPKNNVVFLLNFERRSS